MSGYKNFAVVGAGNVGKFIIDELLNLKASGVVSSVVVVSRSDASAPQWISKGAKFATIDYDSPRTITTAFANIDVVISTVAFAAISKQADLATAAKSANVKLFVPSEFGTPMKRMTPAGPLLEKQQVPNKLKELGLPYTIFFTGPFTDLVFVPHVGWDLVNGKVNIGGEGNTPISFTSGPDAARYVAYVLTALPASEFEWRTFSIEGDRLTYNEIILGYQVKTGKKLEVTYTPRALLEERLAKNPLDILSFFYLLFDTGEGISGTELDNDVWPEWNPKKILDVIA